VFGRSANPPVAPAPGAGSGLARRWQSIRIGHRAMIGLFGGFAVMLRLLGVQAYWNIESGWPNLLGMASMIAGLLYAYTRRCPSCGAGDVVTRMAPQRHCRECGTQFLNDRFF
jgi:ribosomal protein S27AE